MPDIYGDILNDGLLKSKNNDEYPKFSLISSIELLKFRLPNINNSDFITYEYNTKK